MQTLGFVAVIRLRNLTMEACYTDRTPKWVSEPLRGVVGRVGIVQTHRVNKHNMQCSDAAAPIGCN